MNNPLYKQLLDRHDIHLWFMRPDEIKKGHILDNYRGLLCESEIEKVNKFVFKEDRHDALITRATVRLILSQYVGKRAEEIRFITGEKGKPSLDKHQYPNNRIQFNISHTRGLIICAICMDEEIGCDVENTSRSSDVLAIADRYFSEIETKELFSLDEELQRSRFFDYWTLKESYIKACGLGLAIPLEHFSFLINQNEQHGSCHRSDIRLSFSSERKDDPNLWESWLCHSSDDYRIAISLKFKEENFKINNDTNPNHLRPIGDRIKVYEFIPEAEANQMTVEGFCRLNLNCDEIKNKTR